MNTKFLLALFAFCFVLSGFSQTTDNPANDVVQEEMNIYHQELDLSAEQTYHITEILGNKIIQNEAIVAKIETLKKELDKIDVNSDKLILGVLNEDQRVIMQEKLEEKLAKQQEEFKNSLTD